MVLQRLFWTLDVDLHEPVASIAVVEVLAFEANIHAGKLLGFDHEILQLIMPFCWTSSLLV
jgi:hypothetical protein